MVDATPPPIAMLAELTHRCPLKCVYCSNPLDLVHQAQELPTHVWERVFQEAANLGVLQVHLSGGEPAARSDLSQLVAAAHTAGLYTNLITSGLGLKQDIFSTLVERGLDHVQLSIQGADASTTSRVGGQATAFEKKLVAAQWVIASGLPLTINAVVHRLNLDQLEQTIELALTLGARRLEIAHTQFHGWALHNRSHLMPTREQVVSALGAVEQARRRLRGKMVIDYVAPDYFGRFPKACMGGWGRAGLVITPHGLVLPCHAAQSIDGVDFESVTSRPLSDIWFHGTAFNAFRGTGWMSQPCRGCERREIDWGGCRCQAFALTGDASNTDPTCSLSPNRPIINAAVHTAEQRASTTGEEPGPLIYRTLRKR